MIADQGPPGGTGQLEQALAGGRPQRIGWFRYYFDEQRWQWSDVVQQLHGYDAGTMDTPTTQIVLSHKHPDDYHQIAGTIDDIRCTREAFSTRHRIIDTAGSEHDVIVVGEQLHDAAGTVVGTGGFYIDVTPSERAEQQRISAAVAEIAENRAVIEQAKGMLMMVYRIDEQAAFGLLRWRSQETNTKLLSLAEQIVVDFTALSTDAGLPPRQAYDKTPHECPPTR